MRCLFFPLFCIAVALCSCSEQARRSQNVSADDLFSLQDSALAHEHEYSDTIRIRYAKGLKVDYDPDGIHVIVSNPVPTASHAESVEFVIHGKSERFVCTTALQLGNFEVLGLEDKVVGVNSLRNLFSPRVTRQVADGHTLKVGKEGNFDVESIISLQPDYIFVSTSKHGGFESLRECGIPLIPHHGYRETDPLGQAEWIKLIGLLTGETRKANAIFADIEQKYLALRAEVDASYNLGSRPSIMCGRQLRDGWYVVGGQSYMSKIFRDAGALYVLHDNAESGGVTMDFEAAYAIGEAADFWQLDGPSDLEFSMDLLAAEDGRYATMKAFTDRHVLFCNLSTTPYRELAGVQPHLLLADFVKALHPEILPTYTPKYYKLLK